MVEELKSSAEQETTYSIDDLRDMCIEYADKLFDSDDHSDVDRKELRKNLLKAQDMIKFMEMHPELNEYIGSPEGTIIRFMLAEAWELQSEYSKYNPIQQGSGIFHMLWMLCKTVVFISREIEGFCFIQEVNREKAKRKIEGALRDADASVDRMISSYDACTENTLYHMGTERLKATKQLFQSYYNRLDGAMETPYVNEKTAPITTIDYAPWESDEPWQKFS